MNITIMLTISNGKLFATVLITVVYVVFMVIKKRPK